MYFVAKDGSNLISNTFSQILPEEAEQYTNKASEVFSKHYKILDHFWRSSQVRNNAKGVFAAWGQDMWDLCVGVHGDTGTWHICVTHWFVLQKTFDSNGVLWQFSQILLIWLIHWWVFCFHGIRWQKENRTLPAFFLKVSNKVHMLKMFGHNGLNIIMKA